MHERLKPPPETQVDVIDKLPTDDGKISGPTVKKLLSFLRMLAFKINGKLSFGNGLNGYWMGNFDGEYYQFTTPSTPLEEFEVYHALGRVPIGRIIFSQDKEGDLLTARAASWGKTRAVFKCSAASVSFTIGLV